MTDDQKRRYFQRFKSLTAKRFWQEMNELHTRAYAKAEQHYQESMSIVLQPKQAAAVIAKATEIREQWDGMATVTVDETEDAVFKPREMGS
jgi:hypothetical protein